MATGEQNRDVPDPGKPPPGLAFRHGHRLLDHPALSSARVDEPHLHSRADFRLSPRPHIQRVPRLIALEIGEHRPNLRRRVGSQCLGPDALHPPSTGDTCMIDLYTAATPNGYKASIAL